MKFYVDELPLWPWSECPFWVIGPDGQPRHPDIESSRACWWGNCGTDTCPLAVLPREPD